MKSNYTTEEVRLLMENLASKIIYSYNDYGYDESHCEKLAVSEVDHFIKEVETAETIKIIEDIIIEQKTIPAITEIIQVKFPSINIKEMQTTIRRNLGSGSFLIAYEIFNTQLKK